MKWSFFLWAACFAVGCSSRDPYPPELEDQPCVGSCGAFGGSGAGGGGGSGRGADGGGGTFGDGGGGAFGDGGGTGSGDASFLGGPDGFGGGDGAPSLADAATTFPDGSAAP